MQKIDVAIRDSFFAQERVAQALRIEVDRDIRKRKDSTWHYVSRVKGLESFALKVETGRLASINEVEDVFGATLVVPAASELEAATALVLEKYELGYRRPPLTRETVKSPDSFRFDDLRLYVRYRRTEGEKTSIPDGALFEVQIKTFLQHAWAMATHDVIYKTPSRDWRRERIAHQVRASLEAAEVAIQDIDVLADSPMLPQASPEIIEINGIIALLQEHWHTELLPTDIRRLAENVRELLAAVTRGLDKELLQQLQELLVSGKIRSAGQHSLDWSPYRSVLNYVALDYRSRLRAELKKEWRKTKGRRLLVYPETLESVGVSLSGAVGAVVAGE